MERAPRDRRSLDILSVKNEAKLSASEVNVAVLCGPLRSFAVFSHTVPGVSGIRLQT